MRVTQGAACVAMTLVVTAMHPILGQASLSPSIPIRELSAPEAKTRESVGSVLSVRALPGDKLLVNDPMRHQIVMFDATLGNKTAVIDSVAKDGQSYGRGFRQMLSYPGDSALFVDGSSVSLVMITPTGTLGRTMAPPIADHLSNLSRGAWVDDKGNLLYTMPPRIGSLSAAFASRDTAMLRMALSLPESTTIVRASFATRGIDTIGQIKALTSERISVRFNNDHIIRSTLVDPMPTRDDFAVLSDGTIAFVRGHDYHVDLLLPTGQQLRGPKLAFDWKRLTDADKEHLLDSAKAAGASSRARSDSILAARQGSSGGVPRAGAGGGGARGVSGVSGGGSAPPPAEAVNRTLVVEEYGYLPLNRIDDYYPPIRDGALKADMDANLWILPTTSAQSKNGELIYDVVNNRGEMTQRVRIPPGRSIAGFGKNGVVYLMSRDASGWWLERTRVGK